MGTVYTKQSIRQVASVSGTTLHFVIKSVLSCDLIVILIYSINIIHCKST